MSRNKLFFVFVLTFILSYLAGCSSDVAGGATEAGNAKVAVLVVDTVGDPVASARVSVGLADVDSVLASGLSNNEGLFSCSVPKAKIRLFSSSRNAIGILDTTPTPGGNDTITLMIESGGTVIDVISDTNALLSIPSTEYFVDGTGNNKRALFDPMPVGNYPVVVSYKGISTAPRTVTVSVGDTSIVALLAKAEALPAPPKSISCLSSADTNFLFASDSIWGELKAGQWIEHGRNIGVVRSLSAKNDTIFVATSIRAYYYTNGASHQLPGGSISIDTEGVYGITASTSKNVAWFTGDHEFGLIDSSKLIPKFTFSDGRAICIDSSGYPIVATNGKGIYRYNGGAFVSESSLPAAYAAYLFCDIACIGDSNYVAASGSNGMVIKIGSTWTHIAQLHTTSALSILPSGVIVGATYEGGLMAVRQGSSTGQYIPPEDLGLDGTGIVSIANNGSQLVVACGSGVVYRIKLKI